MFFGFVVGNEVLESGLEAAVDIHFGDGTPTIGVVASRQSECQVESVELRGSCCASKTRLSKWRGRHGSFLGCWR